MHTDTVLLVQCSGQSEGAEDHMMMILAPACAIERSTI